MLFDVKNPMEVRFICRKASEPNFNPGQTSRTFALIRGRNQARRDFRQIDDRAESKATRFVASNGTRSSKVAPVSRSIPHDEARGRAERHLLRSTEFRAERPEMVEAAPARVQASGQTAAAARWQRVVSQPNLHLG